MEGRQSETVEIIYLTCNGAGINSPHLDAIELRSGQKRLPIPEGLYVCDACRAAYRRKKYQERIQNAPVKHEPSNRLNKICGDLSDVFKDSN